jgi:dCMP deaminase
MQMIYDELKRPVWQAYFMYLACTVAQRSIDKHTKHGSVIVDDNNNILVTGYNSAPRGVNDKLVPLERPAKYDWMVHSEEAAIATAAKNGIRLDGSTIYVTGLPCCPCLRKLINAGIRRIIYGNVTSKCVDLDKEKVIYKMVEQSNIELVKCEMWDGLFELHEQIQEYLVKYSELFTTV